MTRTLAGLLLIAAGCVTAPPGDGDAASDAPLEVCANAAAPRQLRLLTRREYDATVRDVLGVGDGGGCALDVECDLEVQSCVDRVCTVDRCDVVTFLLPWGAAGEIVVAGSFNGWGATSAAGGWPLQRVPGQDLWYLKRSLPEGEHTYKFVVDGSQWLTDPSNPWTTDDNFGGFNSVTAVRCDASSLTADPSRPSAELLPETRPHGWSFDNHAASGVVSAAHLDAWMQAAERVAASADVARLAPCDPADASCPEQAVRALGRRLFRRPLEPGEVTRYTALAREGASPTEGLRLAVEAMLVSPSFLYRSELGVPSGGGYVLTPYETAAAMSFFLLGTTPDDALLDRAARGELDTPEGREAEAWRMLEDPRARATAREFARQWLGIERALTGDKRLDQFPQWDVATRTSAVRSTQAFYEHVVFDGPGTLDDLLTSPVQYVDARLAAVYGLEGGHGAELAPVEITDPPRPGVLGQASVLAATSYSDQSSPVRRGLFVRERLLCQDLGIPPANAGGVPEVDPTATTRERFEQHANSPACAGCHRYIDPIGFGFEHYDAIGRWRDQDAGRPIDATAHVEDVELDGADTRQPFHSLDELAAILAGSDAAPRCFAREVRRFALGFEEAEDDCAVDELAARFEEAGREVRALMVAVVTSPTFTQRRADPVEAP